MSNFVLILPKPFNIEKILKLATIAILFQDYNDQVIDHITIPNVRLNNSKSVSRFYSGDWKKLEQHLQEESPGSYDVILTSETIYNVDNYNKLVNHAF